MTDREKLALIKRLCLNLSPIDFADEKIAQGASHALVVAIELICDMRGEEKSAAS